MSIMRNRTLSVLCIAFSLFIAKNAYSQEVIDSLNVETPESLASNKTEKNRNEMLNADNSPGPRNVNIGLPFTGDLVILENSLPVVYYYYPTSPLMAWRKDNSLGGMGLLTFTESAIVTGKVGNAVQSNDRDASSSFRGYASIYGNSFGTSRYDVTVTGPFSSNGWGYMLSFFQNFDRGTGINYMFTPWYDRTTMVKGAVQKKYKSGGIKLLYKYVNSKALMSNYSPLIYDGNGETSQFGDFRLGKDSYLLKTGMIPCYNPYTGDPVFADLDSDKQTLSESHNIYLDGSHRFKGGFLDKWKLSYTAMYQTINSPFSVNFPISLMAYMPDQQGANTYYYQGTDKQYEGSVQYITTNMIPQSDNKYLAARTELTKKTSNHDMRLGLNYQYNHRKFDMYAAMYIQSVEPNPSLLDMIDGTYNYQATNKINGALGAGYSGGYGAATNDSYNKIALYASDDIQLTKQWNLGLGLRIEHQNKNDKHDSHGYYYVTAGGRTTKMYETINDAPIMDTDFNNDWNYVFAGNTVYKLTSKFGLLAEATYNSWVDTYWDYPYRDDMGNPIADPGTGKVRQTVGNTNRINVLNFGGGIYYNLGTTLSVVSKVTRITKENVKYNNATITNPNNVSEAQNFDPMFYDISTLGWTTDIVANPFKNFNFHFLFTWQKPQYKNFSYSAFGVTYDYNNNVIPELSQVLMEIDPSYSFMDGKFRAWVSLRYFGKQYGNPTNAFYYNPRWENFCGLDFNASRNFNLKLQVTNFLDQSGVKGAVQGADQITDAAPYEGRIISASYIKPRTIELTANVKF